MGGGGHNRRDPPKAAYAATRRVAADPLLEHGPQPVTTEAEAARAGVVRATIYRRWSGRGE